MTHINSQKMWCGFRYRKPTSHSHHMWCGVNLMWVNPNLSAAYNEVSSIVLASCDFDSMSDRTCRVIRFWETKFQMTSQSIRSRIVMKSFWWLICIEINRCFKILSSRSRISSSEEISTDSWLFLFLWDTAIDSVLSRDNLSTLCSTCLFSHLCFHRAFVSYSARWAT